MVVTTMLRNIKDTGHPLRVKVWNLLTANVWQLAVSDLTMVVSTSVCLPLQQLIRITPGWVRWSNAGTFVQSVYQIAWLTLWIK